MTTFDYNGHLRNMQNDRRGCKFKDKKFLFNILWHLGVMEEKP